MLLKLTILLSVFVFAMPKAVRADILFIDLNLSEKEITSAQLVADKRGEKLVVFPEVSPSIRKYFDDLEQYKAKTVQQIIACKGDLACTEKYLQIYQQAEAQQNQSLSKIAFGPRSLNSFLEQMDREGRAFTAFIESGHSGVDKFGGVFSESIRHEELIQIIQGKSSMQSVRTVLYWGCYSMSIGAVKNRWPKVFPNAHLITGFDQIAPSGVRKESAALLEQTLLRENDAITTGHDLKALNIIFRSFQFSADTNFAMSVDYDTYVSNHNSLHMAEAAQVCSAEKYINYAKVVRCYFDATTEACANPPVDTSGGAIRLSYTAMQGMDHCFDHDMDMINSNEHLELESVLRLIFFKNVKTNFYRFHKEDIRQFDLMLKQAGVSQDLYLMDLNIMSRAEVVKRIGGLVAISKSLSPKLQEMIKSIQYSLVILNSWSVPQSWIEVDPREGIPTGDSFVM